MTSAADVGAPPLPTTDVDALALVVITTPLLAASDALVVLVDVLLERGQISEPPTPGWRDPAAGLDGDARLRLVEDALAWARKRHGGDRPSLYLGGRFCSDDFDWEVSSPQNAFSRGRSILRLVVRDVNDPMRRFLAERSETSEPTEASFLANRRLVVGRVRVDNIWREAGLGVVYELRGELLPNERE